MADKPVRVDIVGDSSNYKKALKEAEDSTGKFGKVTEGAGKALAGAFVGGAVVAGIHNVVDAASDYNETVSKTKVVLGDGADAAIGFAETAAESFGLSQQAALDAQATFAVFGKSAGLAGTDLSDFSGKLTGLAADMASFSNTSPEQAIDAIGAALRGESEPIRAYGVLLDDATLRQTAMEMGIYDGNGALTAQQKVLAAQAAIFKQTGDAQGDFARTSDGLAGQQKILAAEFENLKISLGQHLIPVAAGAIKAFLAIGDAASGMAFGIDLSTASMKAFFAEADSHTVKQLGDELHAMAKAADESHGFISRLSSDLFDSRWDGVNEAFKKMGQESPAALRDVINELRDLQTQAENGDPAAQKLISDYEITTQHLDDLYNAYIAVSPAQSETDRETRKLSGAMGALAVSADDAKQTTDDIAAATAEATRKSDAFAKSIKDQTDKLNDLYGVQYDAVLAKYAYQDSAGAAMKAVADLNTVLGDHKAKQEDVAAAEKAAEDASITLSEQYGTLEGASAKSEGAISRQIKSLENQRDALAPDSPLRAFLQGYIDDLNNIPSNVSTIMSLNVDPNHSKFFTPGGDVIGTTYHPGGSNIKGAEGGIIKASPGGTQVTVAEAGHDEALIPLDGKHGLLGGLTIINNRRDLTVADLNQLLAMARLAS